MTPAEARAWGRGDRRRIATRDFPAAVVDLVVERQGGRFCVACRAADIVTPDDEPLELDHRIPLSHPMGDNRWQNLQLLCRGHNRGKGARARCVTRPPHARGPR